MPRPIDLTSQPFGTLEAIRLAPKQDGQGRLWLCRCRNCGRKVTALAAHLRAGMVKSCGRGPCRGGGIQVDLAGQERGALRILRDSGKRTHQKRLWECWCKICERTKLYTTGALQSDRAVSCGRAGCKRVEHQQLFTAQAIRKRRRVNAQKQSVTVQGRKALSPSKTARYVKVTPCTLLRWKCSCPWLPAERGIEIVRVEAAFSPEFTDYYVLTDLDRILAAMSTTAPIPKMPQQIHTIEAAAHLGIHLATLYQILKARGLKPLRLKVGKRADGRPAIRSFISVEVVNQLKKQRNTQARETDGATRRDVAAALGTSLDSIRWLVRTKAIGLGPHNNYGETRLQATWHIDLVVITERRKSAASGGWQPRRRVSYCGCRAAHQAYVCWRRFLLAEWWIRDKGIGQASNC
jgi:hypothetical protein